MLIESYYAINVSLYLTAQLLITMAFISDEYQTLIFLFYALSDYLLVVFMCAVVSGNIQNVPIYKSFFNKKTVKIFLNLFLLCALIISITYMVLAAPILFLENVYGLLIDDISHSSNVLIAYIAVPLYLTYASYVIICAIKLKASSLAILKKACYHLFANKKYTFILLCFFSISQLITIFIENNIESFCCNNLEIYSLSASLAIIKNLALGEKCKDRQGKATP